jgi:hypothetical protein
MPRTRVVARRCRLLQRREVWAQQPPSARGRLLEERDKLLPEEHASFRSENPLLYGASPLGPAKGCFGSLQSRILRPPSSCIISGTADGQHRNPATRLVFCMLRCMCDPARSSRLDLWSRGKQELVSRGNAGRVSREHARSETRSAFSCSCNSRGPGSLCWLRSTRRTSSVGRHAPRSPTRTGW